MEVQAKPAGRLIEPHAVAALVRWCYGASMRTTLNIEDDVLRAARALAKERQTSLGKVVSDLLRRALAPDRAATYRDEVPVFRVDEAATPITPDMVRQALDED